MAVLYTVVMISLLVVGIGLVYHEQLLYLIEYI